jgi:pilus assembly protein CpaF
MVSALARVEDECRDVVRSLNIDPARDPGEVRRIVEDVVAAYLDRSISATLPPLGDPSIATRRIIDNIAGYGPLQPFLDDRSVEEIWINEPVKTDLRLLYADQVRYLRQDLPG